MTRLRTAVATVLGCGVLVLAGCTADKVTGSAKPVGSSPDVSSIQLQNTTSVSLRKAFNESPQSINDYWTKKRIDDAHPKQPIDPPPPVPSTPVAPPSTPIAPPSTPIAPPTARPTPPPPTQRPGPRDPGANTVIGPTRGKPKNVLLSNSIKGSKWSMTGLTGSTAGRLYFVVNNQNWVCSATVVHSRTKDIVSTAGHCVWDTKTGKGWSQKLLFIPGDKNNGGSSPYGRWTAQRMWAPTPFIKTAKENDTDGAYGAGWQVDFAFMKMDKLNGDRIQSVTGGQGIAFGTAVNSILDIGYPSAPPFTGTSARYCSSHTFDVVAQKFYDRVITCGMTGGCSGGGWLTDYNPADGSGYIIGVNSIGGTGYMYAAQFGDAALGTYNDAVANKK